MQPDAGIVFIGRVRTPWKTRDQCPKNIRIARERGKAASLEIDEPWRSGLQGLEPGAPIVVLYWMHEARRDLIVQAPRHTTEPRGAFALRSPVRPNPVALSAVKLVNIDPASGILHIDAIDCLDGTPLIDVKPWIATIDDPGSGAP